MDCIFCKIVDGSIKGDIVYENDDVVAFRDLNAQAPHHILIIPRKHIATVNDFTAEDASIFGQLGQAAKQIAGDLGVAENGYRLVLNCNDDGGQTVYHTHMHFLAGRTFTWPPG
ncbi:MAG: histidine triad nucleotide-binding protein [Gammaproteobacteria bacterium]|nr:histidine triad nucleotide-binding protein [Gammaproteobacteria bacterium]